MERLLQEFERPVSDAGGIANADVVRALEDLEKQGGLLIRQTEAGSDWLILTPVGAEEAGVADTPGVTETAHREPPRLP
ncbi:MAG TPA: hypothetical protein VGD79_10375 [Thermoanaerobaculia bacterium]